MNAHLYSATGNLLWLIEDECLCDAVFLDYARVAVSLCQDHRADGLMLLNPQTFELWIVNQDGSNGQFCGNGARVAAFHLLQTRDMRQATLMMAGQRLLAKMNADDIEISYLLPEPVIRSQILDQAVQAYALNVPNPHLVIINPRADWQIETQGAVLCPVHDSNIEFVWLDYQKNIFAEIYERGVGVTQACGSGALAIFKVLRHLNLVNDAVCIKMPGGILCVSETDRSVSLAGEVQFLKNEIIKCI